MDYDDYHGLEAEYGLKSNDYDDTPGYNYNNLTLQSQNYTTTAYENGSDFFASSVDDIGAHIRTFDPSAMWLTA